jgi:hypothetical protein
LTSQLPVSEWHDQIGDPAVADGILDRLVHNAHPIEMRDESMRKNRGRKSEENQKPDKPSQAMKREKGTPSPAPHPLLKIKLFPLTIAITSDRIPSEDLYPVPGRKTLTSH